VTTTGDVLAGG